MTKLTLRDLAQLIRSEKESMLKAWRLEVRGIEAAAGLDVPTLNDHIPDLLEEMACELELCSDETMIGELKENAVTHGLDRLRLGFDIEEVVAEYNALRSVIHDMLERNEIELRGIVNRTINRVIDMSIGLAVKTYATRKAVEMQKRREEHLAFVAHDLRSPLACISVAAQLLESSSDGNEMVSTLIDAVKRNVERLNGLVMQVVQSELNLAARQARRIERHPVPLFELVEELLLNLRPLAESSGIQLVNAVPVHLRALADAHMLGLVVQNLLSNAIHYSPAGTVTVGARGLVEPPGIECWVQDTGQGIPADRLEKVFEKLETDPEGKVGLGLGLAIVKEFVGAHNGEVSVSSELGAGSTFHFTIPDE